MLFELVENPQIVAKIVEKVDTNKIRILEETLCHTFYENPLSDEAFEHKLLRLLGETLKVINFGGTTEPYSNHLNERLILTRLTATLL